MGNFETVAAINFNLKEVVKGQGINIIEGTYDKNTAVSTYPLCELFYESEELGYNHGQKPLYNDIEYRLKITLKDTNEQDLQREMQRWVHKIRDGVTINALNINDLASSQLVSKVTTEDIDTTLSDKGIGIVEYDLQVRYREL